MSRPGEDAVNEALIKALNDAGMDVGDIEQFMAMTPMMVKFGEFVVQKMGEVIDDVGALATERAMTTRDTFWLGMAGGLAVAKQALYDGPAWARHLAQCDCLERFRDGALKDFGIAPDDPAAPWQQRGAMDIYNLIGRLSSHVAPGDTDDPWLVGFTAGIAATRNAIQGGDAFVNTVSLKTDEFIAAAREASMTAFKGEK